MKKKTGEPLPDLPINISDPAPKRKAYNKDKPKEWIDKGVRLQVQFKGT